MTTSTPPISTPSHQGGLPSAPGRQRKLTRAELRAEDAKTKLSSPAASIIALIIALLWTVPTLGLLVTSFRPQEAINDSGWWTTILDPRLTLDNYTEALTGGRENFSDFFINSLVITLPSVIIPITLALLAAYAFAWIPFRGRNILFVAVFTLQIVPIQVTLIPLLTLYVDLGVAGSFWPVWISHAMFGLPLAIFLLHNFMKDIPASLVEAAQMDGAGHVRIFFQVLLPLLTPAIAAFGVFQFLWVWNDLLIALTFGSSQNIAPLTVRLAELSGTRGNSWFLLSAGAFLSLLLPLAIFLGLQRFFVRGMLSGSVKG